MDGIINIRKEKGFTSHDVVAVLRGVLHTKKIGHTGTLDPMAEGVLPVCVGSATKLCEAFTDHDKEYAAVMRLGEVYDTLDITGVMQEKREVNVTNDEITAAIKSFIGGYNQIPPMYSAKKVDGKKLYELARSGKVIERKPQFVKIYDIEITDISLPCVSIRVHCGKGTYIRSLISDIGEKLSCGACMEELIRTRVGDFSIEDSVSLDEIKGMTEEEITRVTLGVETIFDKLKPLYMTPKLSKAVLNGNPLKSDALAELGIKPGEDFEDRERIRVYTADKRFVGIYEYKRAEGALKVYKMFVTNHSHF